MDAEAVIIDDQPISSSFFGVGGWLTDYITPNAFEVRKLYMELMEGVPDDLEQQITALWAWVASEVKYVPFVSGQLRVGNYVSHQRDVWLPPSMVIKTKLGNCANKAFLLTSLIRNLLSADNVFCVLGNLHQPGEGGHAWVEVTINSIDFILETTHADMVPFTNRVKAEIYEDVIYVNDQGTYAIEGRTLLQPFCAVYAAWLKDYLNWTYINREAR